MRRAMGVAVVAVALGPGCGADEEQGAEPTGGRASMAGQAGAPTGGTAGEAGASAGGASAGRHPRSEGGGAGTASAGRSGMAGNGGQGGAPSCDPLPVGGAGGSGGGNALSIIGEYSDDFGGTHLITATTWTQFGVFEITRFSNEDGWLVARGAATNEYNPCLWSRFDFAEYEGELYFCQGTFDAASEAEALAASPADASDPTAGGCGNYPWSRLTPQ